MFCYIPETSSAMFCYVSDTAAATFSYVPERDTQMLPSAENEFSTIFTSCSNIRKLRIFPTLCIAAFSKTLTKTVPTVCSTEISLYLLISFIT